MSTIAATTRKKIAIDIVSDTVSTTTTTAAATAAAITAVSLLSHRTITTAPSPHRATPHRATPQMAGLTFLYAG